MGKIYFLRFNQYSPKILREAGRKISKLFIGFFGPEEKVAVKVHFGERGSLTYLSPILVESIYSQLKTRVEKAALVDCNVLYKGDRSFGTTHKQLAEDHGFGFGEILIADGEKGENESVVEINQKHFKEVKIGGRIIEFDALLVISHFTGHGGVGFGGALKNVGMGLASKGGKLAMHQALKLRINPQNCQGCFACLRECPAEAILERDQKAEIDPQKCLGCGRCISVCPSGAAQVPWKDGREVHSAELQERIVEYAFGALKGKRAFFINVLLNVTRKCDCHGEVQEPIVPDIGILASEDIVGIDQASFDLVRKGKMYFGSVDPTTQIEYAQNLGLGEKNYDLIEIDCPFASKLSV